MSNEAPTDALRLVPVEPTRGMMDAAVRVDWTNEDERATVINIWQSMLAASPASPLPGGGPTCQVCGSVIEAWTCQGCGAQFHENDAGSLVLGAPTAETAGQCSGITGELNPRLVEWGYTSLDEAITHLGQLLDNQAAFDGLAAQTGDRP